MDDASLQQGCKGLLRGIGASGNTDDNERTTRACMTTWFTGGQKQGRSKASEQGMTLVLSNLTSSFNEISDWSDHHDLREL